MNGVLIELTSQIDMLSPAPERFRRCAGGDADQPGHAARLHCLRVPSKGADVRELTDYRRRTRCCPNCEAHRRRGLRVPSSGAVGQKLSPSPSIEDRIDTSQQPQSSAKWTRNWPTCEAAAQQRAGADHRRQAPARPREKERARADFGCGSAGPTLRRRAAFRTAIAQLKAQKAELQTQLDQVNAGIAQPWKGSRHLYAGAEAAPERAGEPARQIPRGARSASAGARRVGKRR